MAVANYQETYGVYPPAYIADSNGRPMHSWRVLLLPFLEGAELYEQYDFSRAWNDPENLKIANRMPPTYAAHGDYAAGRTTTNYLAVVGDNTMWPGAASRRSDEIPDGTEFTILIVENVGADVHWLEPRDLQVDTMSFAIDSPGGISSKYEMPAVATASTCILRIDRTLSEANLRAALTVDGGEKLDADLRQSVIPDGRLRPEK